MSNKKALDQLPGSVVMGTIVPFVSPANKLEGSGWLLCDGSVIDPKYQSLRTALGHHYTPNLQGLALVGSGSSYKLGDTGGEETHTLIEGEMPSHTHNYRYKEISGSGTSLGAGAFKGNKSVSSTTFNQGGGKAHNNMQPYQVVHYIIYTGQGN